MTHPTHAFKASCLDLLHDGIVHSACWGWHLPDTAHPSQDGRSAALGVALFPIPGVQRDWEITEPPEVPAWPLLWLGTLVASAKTISGQLWSAVRGWKWV